MAKAKTNSATRNMFVSYIKDGQIVGEPMKGGSRSIARGKLFIVDSEGNSVGDQKDFPLNKWHANFSEEARDSKGKVFSGANKNMQALTVDGMNPATGKLEPVHAGWKYIFSDSVQMIAWGDLPLQCPHCGSPHGNEPHCPSCKDGLKSVASKAAATESVF